MRVLDLGSHDGFVTNWLGRTVRERGIDLHVDGIEANTHGVQISNDRAKADGLAGEYRVGLAEDAANIFEPGTYDAVVAFELIEHVADVPQFLSVCEAMCKPGGRVYLSTPNGTFGAGQNPHHLRVYRSVDLFELCRDRGEVIDLVQGHDGVVVIAYSPDTPVRAGAAILDFDRGVTRVASPVKPRATIHTGAVWQAWDPDDIDIKGLGGSETAAVHVANALAADGYAVTVYGTFDEPMMRGQVVYRHHAQFDPLDECELAIISRQPTIFERPIRARRKVLWMHDTDYGPLLTEELADRMDAIIVLSDWHRGHVEQLYPFLAGSDRLIVSRNGIDPRRFPSDLIPPTDERPTRAIYSSSPDRGLDLLLELWPDVRKRLPGAELVYCYSSVYDAAVDGNPKLKAHRDRIRELEDQEGVVNLGSLDQVSLAGAMAKARVWLAPSWCTPIDRPFMETFCIGAIEAAAAGCRRVMSEWGALAERWENGDRDFMVEGKHADGTLHFDRADFIEGIVRKLRVTEDIGMSEQALAMTWDGVARDLAGVAIATA